MDQDGDAGRITFVEVSGKTVDEAVAVGLAELNLESVDEAEVEVLQDAQRGFLGLGGKDAVVRVKAKPKRRRRRRGGRGRRSRDEGDAPPATGESTGAPKGQSKAPKGQARDQKKPKQKPSRSDSGGRQKQADAKGQQKSRRKSGAEAAREKKHVAGQPSKKTQPAAASDSKPPVDVEAQARVVDEFLVGLLAAYGLEGEVDVRADDGIIFAEVTGEQTEALVGSRGAIMQSILELCRTIVQRKTHHSARIRLDIAGYGARRREALAIYASRLAQQVLEDGGETMLEPMNPADRKVVHDAVGEIDGVRSFSEGEEPNRSVVLSLAPGVEPTGALEADTSDAEDSSDDQEPSDAESAADAASTESDEEEAEDGDEGAEESSDDAEESSEEAAASSDETEVSEDTDNQDEAESNDEVAEET